MVITNQGVAIQPCFSSKTTCSFENRPIGCVYKTGAKHASKDGIELVVFKAFREILIEVLSFGLGVAELVLVRLLTVLLVNRLSLVHTVIYDAHKQAHIEEKRNKGFIVELESETIKIWRWE